MDVTEEIGQEYPPDTWRIIDGEITRTTTYSTSSYTTTLCWCQGCEEPWMMYDDGSGTHGDCLGPSVPLGSLLPMQSGRKGDDVAESEDFDPCGSFDCSLPKGHNMGRADIPANHHSEEIESLSWRCKDEGHEFLCRMAEGSCVRCIPQQAQSQQALTDQFAVGHQAVTRLGLYDLADWMRAAFFGSSEVQPIWQLGGRGQGGSA